MNKLLSLLIVSVFCSYSFASSIDAPGELFYKMPTGEIVTRIVSLIVPARGEGDVILKTGSQDIKAHRFETSEAHGKKTFKVMFLNPPNSPEGTCLILTGTYMRGTNLALYYGDMYKSFQTSEFELAQIEQSVFQEDGHHGHHGHHGDHGNEPPRRIEFAGGFKFQLATRN